MQKYKHLNFEQRYTIECMLKGNHKKKAIYTAIGISESALYRELSRNSKPRGSYCAKYAQILADERSKEGHVKKHLTQAMQRYIKEKLCLYQWSPEQILGRAKLEGINMVSHERIYQFIWKDKHHGGTLYKHLRTGHKKYRKRYGNNHSRGQIPDRVSIDKRPAIVEEKQHVGDFESDLIIGKNHKGALLTIVDRYSSFLLIEDVKTKEKSAIKKHTINALAPYKKHTHTITNDNGKEFTAHKTIAKKLDCKVFFAHPYASWERGLNEYTNKLIRQYFPKKQTLENIPKQKIIEVMNLLNNRPRKKLGYKTPKEIFYQYINQYSKLALAS